ncbi:MAG: aspartate 1-decarboxylase [Candidatus Thermoplasmatota archaeon]|nr:aspartate 1-decarboxylase [Candidatus Thermoplasmatota archaeon]
MSGRRKTLLSGKIHRATVTQADLNYIGSVSIDEDLLDASGISEWEKVAILDVTNGARLETYAIKAPRGSREICINGAAAHLVKPGDVVIILSYVEIEEEFIEMHVPRIVLVNSENRILETVSSESNF